MSTIRLNKLLATRGIGARRKCDALIESGAVRVNGEVVTAPGTRVTVDLDRITVNGQLLPGPTRHRYLMVNKPVGMITTLDDPEGRRTIRELLPPGPRLYPVGRLDADTSGLLIVTNDGDLAHHLMHPRYGLSKHYRVLLVQEPTDAQIDRLGRGVEFEPGVVSAPAQVRRRDPNARGSVIEITIHEGRYRQVRRMCEAVGLDVLGLHRWAYGPLRLGELARGMWRELSDDEVEMLRASSARPRPRPAGFAPPRAHTRGVARRPDRKPLEADRPESEGTAPPGWIARRLEPDARPERPTPRTGAPRFGQGGRPERASRTTPRTGAPRLGQGGRPERASRPTPRTGVPRFGQGGRPERTPRPELGARRGREFGAPPLRGAGERRPTSRRGGLEEGGGRPERGRAGGLRARPTRAPIARPQGRLLRVRDSEFGAPRRTRGGVPADPRFNFKRPGRRTGRPGEPPRSMGGGRPQADRPSRRAPLPAAGRFARSERPPQRFDRASGPARGGRPPRPSGAEGDRAGRPIARGARQRDPRPMRPAPNLRSGRSGGPSRSGSPGRPPARSARPVSGPRARFTGQRPRPAGRPGAGSRPPGRPSGPRRGPGGPSDKGRRPR